MRNPAQPVDRRDPVFDFALRKTPSPKVPDEPPAANGWYLKVTVDFLRECSLLKITRDGILLYQYMLLRSANCENKRLKCPELYGDMIKKGEFFENKLRVATALGKGHIKDKSKINWFGRTVKPLVELGLVKQIRVGRRGYNATFIVIDICELELIKK